MVAVRFSIGFRLFFFMHISFLFQGCDTRQGCERRQAQTSSACQRDYYNDWACVECCSGDLCNYYVTVRWHFSMGLLLYFTQTFQKFKQLITFIVNTLGIIDLLLFLLFHLKNLFNPNFILSINRSSLLITDG